MITPITTVTYDWFDIQTELCDIMEIPEDKFRDYHKIVGGKYKDFWHVCLESIIPDQMSNYTTVTMYEFEGELFEGDEEWKNRVLEAWNTFMKSINADNIYVNFSW